MVMDQAQFETTHVYSKSPKAAAKRALDAMIMGTNSPHAKLNVVCLPPTRARIGRDATSLVLESTCQLEGDYSKGAMIDYTDEAYLKALIKLASSNTVKVSDSTRSLQFVIIQGGAEGFLDPSLKDMDASRQITHWGVESAHPEKLGTMIFDCTNLLAVFDKRGGLTVQFYVWRK
jgi:hypothetical protein